MKGYTEKKWKNRKISAYNAPSYWERNDMYWKLHIDALDTGYTG